MNIQAIQHIAKSNYAFATAIDTLHVRVRTAKNDATAVNIIHLLKFDTKHMEKHPMVKILTDEYFDYYEYIIISEDTRIGYYFEITGNDDHIFYYEDSMSSSEDASVKHNRYFQFPAISAIDIHKVPSWVNDTIFYQIFPERFRNGHCGVANKETTPWNEFPTNDHQFYGGDLQGIIEALPYLTDLGINGIYLTPIFTSTSSHKYNTANYMEIDPHFGTKEIFRDFVEKSHAKGIKIVLDAVFNHCGHDFAPFQDVLKNGENSIYKDWFFIESYPVIFEKRNYKTFAHAAYMPKINTANPEAKAYLLNVAKYWIEEFHIDGWRLDVSDEVDHHFWRDFRRVVREANPEAVIIGENWHDSAPWLQGDQYDSVMNYVITSHAINYFAKGSTNALEFQNGVSNALFKNTAQVNSAMLNLLDSHDTERFLTTCSGDKRHLMNAAAMIMSYVGMPCTYYGTEIGMDGNAYIGCRAPFDWDETHWDTSLHDFYKQIIHIRKSEKSLRYGDINLLSNENVFIMRRSYENETIYTIINNTDSKQHYILTKSDNGGFVDLISGMIINGTELDISAESCQMLKQIDN